MARFRPQTATIDIERKPCPQCGARMLLARIEPAQPGHDVRTFECPGCEHTERTVAKF